MRVLGIETSSVQGSVALIDGGQTIGFRSHSRLNAHGETIQPLVDELLEEAGWSRQQLDRIAVGIGPGSFTGLRVGIALALGMGEGLKVPVVGVSSLQSMTLLVPETVPGVRCALLDARRNEIFAGAYDLEGNQILAPCALLRESAHEALVELLGKAFVAVGNGCELMPELQQCFRSESTDLPNATATAILGQKLAPEATPTPCYVRNDVAIRPHLPPNPLKL